MARPTSIHSHLPAAAVAWVEAHVDAPVTAADPLRRTARSTVVRLSTGAGDRYFKEDRILPPPEAAVLSRLAARWPDRVAPVIAIDEGRGFSLTRDAGSAGLEGADTSAWRGVVRAFARVQRDSGLSAEDWIAIGCRDLRPDRLAARFDEMLEGCRSHLDARTWDTLRRLRPRIAEACEDLAGDGVPPGLVHQDLVPENVVLRDGEPVFLDWSDTVVGHPFFGCDRLLDSCWTDPERKAAVIDAYLGEFAGVAPAARLRASFDRVLWLRVLYEDLRWHHEILAVGPDSEHAKLLRKDMVLGLTQVARHQR